MSQFHCLVMEMPFTSLNVKPEALDSLINYYCGCFIYKLLLLLLEC